MAYHKVSNNERNRKLKHIQEGILLGKPRAVLAQELNCTKGSIDYHIRLLPKELETTSSLKDHRAEDRLRKLMEPLMPAIPWEQKQAAYARARAEHTKAYLEGSDRVKPGKLKYNLIGTEDDPIPELEPVFILRAQDTLGEVMLHFYASLCEVELNNFPLARAVREHAKLFHEWPTKKRPDL